MYDELVKRLRICPDYNEGCVNCPHEHDLGCRTTTMHEAANAIEELQKVLGAVNDAHNEGYDVGYWAGRRDYEPKWIPVTERLPKKHEVVIALNKRGKQHDIDKAYWNGFSFYRHYRKAPYSNVTHWMPLPEPPKEE